MIMIVPKACVGDYIPNLDWIYSRIIDITENDGEWLYYLDSGLVIADRDFHENDIRLESEIFG